MHRIELRPWTADETGTSLAAAERIRLSAAFVLMATGGFRRGEVLGLRWSDVDLDRRSISIRQALVLVGNSPTLSEPKTEAGRRSIPLATH
jgi:integrase